MTLYTGDTLIKETIGRAQVVSASVRLPETSPLAILSHHGDEPRLYWRSGETSPIYAGIGVAAALTADGRGRFEQVREHVRALFEGASSPAELPAPARPRVFGGFAYDPAFEAQGIWSAFSSALFVLPRFQIAQFDGETWLTANVPQAHGARQDAEALLRKGIEQVTAGAKASKNGHNGSPAGLEIDYLAGQETWAAMVGEAVTRIRRGELEKVVLARAAEMHSTRPIDPARALAALDERYPDCYRFLIEPAPGRAFFGATPELLATIDGRQVRTGALAGSIARGATPEEDAALGASLLASAKNRHEHAVVVQDITRRLGALTGDLTVSDTPSLRRLQNIQHLHTAIAGQLGDGIDALHVVEALHPTPALGGAPREAAWRVIGELEQQPRGWYGGPVGWLAADGSAQFAVAIRSAVSAGNDARLYSGAGIVADSVPESEWQETALKFRPLLDAITASLAPAGEEEHQEARA